MNFFKFKMNSSWYALRRYVRKVNSPGAMYPIVPPTSTRLFGMMRPGNRNFADPKSLRRAVMSLSKRMLLGFKSQWTKGGVT